VDCGFSQISISPCWDGRRLPHAMRIYPIAGHALAKFMRIVLMERHDYDHDKEEAITYPYHKYMKELRVAENFDQELKEIVPEVPKHYYFGISLLEYAIIIPELLFSPWKVLENDGHAQNFKKELLTENWIKETMTELVVEAIEACAPHQRDILKKHVYLIGGLVKLEGFVRRVRVEMNKLDPLRDIQIHVPDHPCKRVIMGAEIYANLEDFRSKCEMNPAQTTRRGESNDFPPVHERGFPFGTLRNRWNRKGKSQTQNSNT